MMLANKNRVIDAKLVAPSTLSISAPTPKTNRDSIAAKPSVPSMKLNIHAYQRLHHNGWSHKQVLAAACILNIYLCGLIRSYVEAQHAALLQSLQS